MRQNPRWIMAFGMMAAVLPALAAPPLADDSDKQDKAEALFRIERAINENCLICHSNELIQTQRLTPAQWKAEVEKMVGWGSPLPAELHVQVIDHLSARYGSSMPTTPEVRTNLSKFQSIRVASNVDREWGDRRLGATLYAENCANCHGVDGQGADLGNNLVEKPVLLDMKSYEQVVRDGRGRMPGFSTKFKSNEGKDVLAWLRARRYQPVLPASP